MHVVVIGCGRVGSELAGALEHGGPHASRSSTRTPAPSAACPPTSAGSTVVGFGFDRDHLDAGRHRRGRRVRLRHERRQLQHPVRPDRPRDLRHRARRRPHLRPPPRADLPAARHPHRRDRRVDHRPGAAPAAPGRDQQRLGRPDRAASASSSGRSRPRRSGKKLGAAQPARPLLAHRGDPLRQGADRHRPTWSARRATCSCSCADDRRHSTSCRRTSSREAKTDAGRDRRRRQRRAVHRQRPRERGPRGAAHRAEPGRRATRAPTPTRASSGSSPTRARSRRCARPGSSAATSSSPRPATTRTTS